MSELLRKITEVLEFKVEKEDEGKRLDAFLAEAYGEFSRSYIQKLIEDGYVFVNQKETRKASKKVKTGYRVSLFVPEPEPLDIRPENIPIDIVYEDDDLLLLIKPCGLVVHPSPGHTSGTLVNALLFHVKDLSSISGVERPGIVHRLDKGTAGLMVVAKSDQAHINLVRQFQGRKVLKFYHALVSGIVKEDEGVVEKPISRHPAERKKFRVSAEGRYAKTEYRVLERFYRSRITYLDVRLHTGRTHQIRVHMWHMGYPILGDRTYGFKRTCVDEEIIKLMGECHMLVSYRIAFEHPSKGQWMDFKIDDPQPFKSVLSFIKKSEEKVS